MEIADVLGRLRRGEISAPVALARLLIASGEPEKVEAALSAAGEDALLNLLRARREGAEAVSTMLRAERSSAGAYGPSAGLARWRAVFDDAVARNPETSVAFYSLGDPDLLAEATEEIARWLFELGLLDRRRRVLDLGCGFGRVALAIAPLVRAVVGVDLSPNMIAEARRRRASRDNVAFEVTDGRDLAMFRSESFELVLAVDALPLIHAADPALLARHVAEAARVLVPGGDLVALNLTYRSDPAADLAEAAALAQANGLTLLAGGERPFRLWDGAAYRFGKAAGFSASSRSGR